MKALLRDPDKFRSWLQSHDPNAACGKRGRTYVCPIAAFLAETAAVREVAVRADSIRASNDGRWVECPTPRWAARFILMIDDGPPGTAVTADEALRVLTEAVKA